MKRSPIIRPSLLGLLLTLVQGCGASKTPVATEQDELSQYLDEHPELNAPKEEYDLEKEKFNELNEGAANP